jgi:predicted AAA+ superfamily ATPase
MRRAIRYVTFDDDVQLAAAAADPVGFAADLPHKTILDEVQPVPALFLALTSAADRDRRPGRFILTGSANVLKIGSIAGHLCIHRSRRPAEKSP